MKCGSVAGDMSFPETMIKDIVHDNIVGYAAGSASVSEARTYGPGTREQALVRAVAGGDVDAVRKLIEAGGDINGLYYWSPKILGPPGTHGVVLYVPSSPESAHSGNTPLMLAAGRGNAIMVRLLLEKGANPNLRRSLDDKGRSSALCKAVAGHSNQEVLQLILSSHPDTESVETAFASIAGNKFTLQSYIDIFLKHGISAQCRQQVLMKAKKGGNKHIVYLIEDAYQKHDKSTQKKE